MVRSKARAAKRAYENCVDEKKWLTWEDLEKLHDSGTYGLPEKYTYDPESVRKRGWERCNEVIKELPGNVNGLKALEIGALDAMVSYFLNEKGVETHAIDITDSHFSEKVTGAGVECRVMSATDLDYTENIFDLVFSFNAFEHIDDPAKAFSEAIRAVKPGGFIYLNFGPLWSSPFGAHGHEAIPIPYIQFLWSEDLLLEFCEKQNLGTIEFHTLNKWNASKYRDLWDENSDQLETLVFRERLDSYGSELIEKYPECFRGKVDYFDELIISAVEVLFRKM